MTINNSRDLILELGVTDHLIFGSNRQLAPGTFIPNDETGESDSVTFVGTRGNDTLVGGGGETATFFLGTGGNDLYGVSAFTNSYADYSSARSGVVVDLTLDGGTRTFTDESGDGRTVHILGKVLKDGFGGRDSFIESPDLPGYSGILGVIGSHFSDWIVGSDFSVLHGGRGNDTLIGSSLYGGAGKDHLFSRSALDFGGSLEGGDGDDFIWGSDFVDHHVLGGAGRDYIDTRSGDDFIDAGIGADVILSGAGNDTINPDVEFFQYPANPQPTDGARDVIRVTRADVGDFTDVVLTGAFEAGHDQIRFRDAVRGGVDFRVYQEQNAVHPDLVNTVLQIDQNGDGFGGGTPDTSDYFLVAAGADLTLHHGYLLT